MALEVLDLLGGVDFGPSNTTVDGNTGTVGMSTLTDSSSLQAGDVMLLLHSMEDGNVANLTPGSNGTHPATYVITSTDSTGGSSTTTTGWHDFGFQRGGLDNKIASGVFACAVVTATHATSDIEITLTATGSANLTHQRQLRLVVVRGADITDFGTTYRDICRTSATASAQSSLGIYWDRPTWNSTDVSDDFMTVFHGVYRRNSGLDASETESGYRQLTTDTPNSGPWGTGAGTEGGFTTTSNHRSVTYFKLQSSFSAVDSVTTGFPYQISRNGNNNTNGGTAHTVVLKEAVAGGTDWVRTTEESVSLGEADAEVWDADLADQATVILAEDLTEEQMVIESAVQQDDEAIATPVEAVAIEWIANLSLQETVNAPTELLAKSDSLGLEDTVSTPIEQLTNDASIRLEDSVSTPSETDTEFWDSNLADQATVILAEDLTEEQMVIESAVQQVDEVIATPVEAVAIEWVANLSLQETVNAPAELLAKSDSVGLEDTVSTPIETGTEFWDANLSVTEALSTPVEGTPVLDVSVIEGSQETFATPTETSTINWDANLSEQEAVSAPSESSSKVWEASLELEDTVATPVETSAAGLDRSFSENELFATPAEATVVEWAASLELEDTVATPAESTEASVGEDVSQSESFATPTEAVVVEWAASLELEDTVATPVETSAAGLDRSFSENELFATPAEATVVEWAASLELEDTVATPVESTGASVGEVESSSELFATPVESIAIEWAANLSQQETISAPTEQSAIGVFLPLEDVVLSPVESIVNDALLVLEETLSTPVEQYSNSASIELEDTLSTPVELAGFQTDQTEQENVSANEEFTLSWNASLSPQETISATELESKQWLSELIEQEQFNTPSEFVEKDTTKELTEALNLVDSDERWLESLIAYEESVTTSEDYFPDLMVALESVAVSEGSSVVASVIATQDMHIRGKQSSISLQGNSSVISLRGQNTTISLEGFSGS